MIENFYELLEQSRPKSKIFTERHRCGQRYTDHLSPGDATNEVDTWGADETCSYCGSLHPEILLKRLEDGTASAGPTDKNYKIYVRNDGGEQFKQQYRIDELSEEKRSDPRHWIWTVQDTDQTKFYFQHLDNAQKKRFIDLYNAKTMKIGMPGYFYTTPYFCTPLKDGSSQDS